MVKDSHQIGYFAQLFAGPSHGIMRLEVPMKLLLSLLVFAPGVFVLAACIVIAVLLFVEKRLDA